LGRINEDLQKYALFEIKQFNKYYNRTQRKLKKRNLNKNKIQIFNQIINYFQQYNQGKKSNYIIQQKSNTLYNPPSQTISKTKKPPDKKYYRKEDPDNINLTNIYLSLNNTDINPSTNDTEKYNSFGEFTNNNLYNSSNLFPLSFNKSIRKNSLKRNKLKIPTVDELFDLANNEGEKEAIIDDELHSDDEIVFEAKIKSKKKIITDYLPTIKKSVPNLYLSQIEFNKSKVMNEADLYSHLRRQFQMQNVDENINIMRKKLKILKRRCKINEEKYETIQNFAKECEKDYNRLKAIKVQMSMKQEKVNFMRKEFFNQHTKDIIDEEDELNYQKEMDDYLNDPELNDPYFEQYQALQTDMTNRQIEKENNILKKISKDNIENNEKNKKKYEHIRTHRERKKEKIKRANSK
jgi:hypothetical protein